MQVKKQKLESGIEQGTDSKLRKEYRLMLSPYLLKLYAEYIIWNAGLNES